MRERRNCQRYPVCIPCKLILDGKQLDGTIVDISAAGVAFICHVPPLSAIHQVELVVDDWSPHWERQLRLKLSAKNRCNRLRIDRVGCHLDKTPEAFSEFFESVVHDSTSHKAKRLRRA
ncbi:PilZ domain-containing protein [Thiomicrorhabdus sp. 6S3-12]|uniref:PilZ domain-containing protein n=1 Tax=Thiomicrorhabdus sp. 6S3-12 TaxID=2819681 RepID=UPI001AAC7261|nr:PilZ domain-containing protein [Thiomicrorhabdus sp. 6S3-12]MBO1924615.1 PilZ domain-containing protein [Thiomicrorhabdus sp. 6S3-12]